MCSRDSAPAVRVWRLRASNLMATVHHPPLAASESGIGSVVGRYRWRICALLFFVTTLNYMDRQVLGVLAPELQRVIGWDELQYGYIVAGFQAAYALGLVAAGGFIDRVGTRIGYAVAIA